MFSILTQSCRSDPFEIDSRSHVSYFLDTISGIALLVIGALIAAGIIPFGSISTPYILIGLGCFQLFPFIRSLFSASASVIKSC